MLVACIEEESCVVEGKALDSMKEGGNMAGEVGVGGVGGGVVRREETSSLDPINDLINQSSSNLNKNLPHLLQRTFLGRLDSVGRLPVVVVVVV